MTGVDSWSITPATNATADGGYLDWAEQQLPSTVNDSARQMTADLRSAFNDLAWFQYGTGDQNTSTHLAVPCVYASATSFTITGSDVTSAYHANRRVRAVGTVTGTIYGSISSSSYDSGSTITTVNVTWDSGSLSDENLVVSISQVPVTGLPVPVGAVTGALAKANNLSDLANPSAARTNLGAASIDDTLFAKGPVETIANAPDASPTIGLRRLIGTSPTGVWVGRENQVAEYFADGWHYSGAPTTGQKLFVQPNNAPLIYDGSEWGFAGAPSLVNAPYYPLYSGAKGADPANDDSAAINAAIVYAADQKRILRLDRQFYATGMKLQTDAWIEGNGRDCGIIAPAGSAAGAIVSLFDANVLRVHLHNFLIDGNKANQSLAQTGLLLDQTGIALYGETRHSVSDLLIQNVNGDGQVVGYDQAACFLSRVSIYNCDGRGLYLSGTADFILSDYEIGKSLLSGAELTKGTYQLSNMKVWGSGQYSNSIPQANYYFHNAGNVTGVNLLSQEASGDGFLFFNSAGFTNGHHHLLGLVSDADGVCANRAGFRLTNTIETTIRGRIGKISPALAGTPAQGLIIGGDCFGNDIVITTDSNVATPIYGAGIGSNRIIVNGNARLFVENTDDFLGDSLSPAWDEKHGTNGSIVPPTINAQIGGVCRLVTGADAGGTMALNGVHLQSQLTWQAGKGGLVFEARVNLSAITNVAVFLGFTDQVAALEMPIYGAGGGNGLTSDASNAVGILFDTTMTTAHWWLTGVKADVDATAQDSGVAPVAATYEVWRIVFDSAGNATFLRNGALVGTAMANAVTASTPLTPIIAAFSRGAASRNIDVDYIRIGAVR